MEGGGGEATGCGKTGKWGWRKETDTKKDPRVFAPHPQAWLQSRPQQPGSEKCVCVCAHMCFLVYIVWGYECV